MLTRAEKQQWIAALRSGKYKQGKWYLKRIDETGEIYHCCMGVLCEVKKVRELTYSLAFDENQRNIGATVEFVENDGNNFASMPPDWGFDKHQLAEFNDNAGMTFDQIADWIEQNVETSG